MLRTYEGLFILNTAGKEEGSKEIIEKLEKEIQTAGGKTVKIERMDRRPFARVAQEADSGYYVNIVFELAPDKLAPFKSKLKLDEDVFRVMFLNSSNTLRSNRQAETASA
jgi:small subunit ribosomal protein S6